MGFYARHILPKILDLAMRNKEAARLRAAWIPKARGEVLEVGIGSGLNLPFYSAHVQHVYGVDPSLELQRMARGRVAGSPIGVDFLPQSAEEPVPLPAASVDTVVSTWSLCSIPDAVTALQQAKRVLKPDGVLIFIEHGSSPEPGVRAWQDRLTPAWKHVVGGCHLNRKIATIIEEAGFHITELETEYLRGPRPMMHTYKGCARMA